MFKFLSAVELRVAVLRGLLAHGHPSRAIGDVILGHCYPSSEAPAIGRIVISTWGCRSRCRHADRPSLRLGLQAVIQAAMQVATGQNDLVVAGGAESMSNVIVHFQRYALGRARDPGVQVHDGLARGRVTAGGKTIRCRRRESETAENLRRGTGSRVRTGTNWRCCRINGRQGPRPTVFSSTDHPGHGDQSQGVEEVSVDEHPRADTTVESLAGCDRSWARKATVTAGNASGQNDAASMCNAQKRATCVRW